MTDCVVVDTNVFAVAEGLHEASDSCKAACVRLAEQVREGLMLAVDTDDQIFREYLDALHGSQRSDLATKMVARLYHRRYTACRRLEIHPASPPEGTYEEVPQALRDFDVDDQKFIAVANAGDPKCPIFTAVDGEWWTRRDDFVSNGIDVQFVCASDLIDRERTERN